MIEIAMRRRLLMYVAEYKFASLGMLLIYDMLTITEFNFINIIIINFLFLTNNFEKI